MTPTSDQASQHPGVPEPVAAPARIRVSNRARMIAVIVVAVAAFVAAALVITGGDRSPASSINPGAVPSGEFVIYSAKDIDGLEQVQFSMTGAYDSATNRATAFIYRDQGAGLKPGDVFETVVWDQNRQFNRPASDNATGPQSRWVSSEMAGRSTFPGMASLESFAQTYPEMWQSIISSLHNSGSRKVPVTNQSATLFEGEVDYQTVRALAQASAASASTVFAPLDSQLISVTEAADPTEPMAPPSAQGLLPVYRDSTGVKCTVQIWVKDGAPVAMRLRVDPSEQFPGAYPFSVTEVITTPGAAQTIAVPSAAELTAQTQPTPGPPPAVF